MPSAPRAAQVASRAFLSPWAGSYPHRWHTGNGRCGCILCDSTRWWPRLLGSWNRSGEERGKTGESTAEGPGTRALQTGPLTDPTSFPPEMPPDIGGKEAQYGAQASPGLNLRQNSSFGRGDPLGAGKCLTSWINIRVLAPHRPGFKSQLTILPWVTSTANSNSPCPVCAAGTALPLWDSCKD